MAEPASFDWMWLGNGAIDEFKQWRVRAGATTASASSYATGARVFVRYCRGIDSDPSDAIESFPNYLARLRDLSDHSRADYRSHARAFVRFLHGTHRSHLRGIQYPEVVSSPSEEVSDYFAGSGVPA